MQTYCSVPRASQFHTWILTLLAIQSNSYLICGCPEEGTKQNWVAETFLANYLEVSSERYCWSGTGNHSNVEEMTVEPQGRGTPVLPMKTVYCDSTHFCTVLFFIPLTWVPAQPSLSLREGDLQKSHGKLSEK